MLEQTIKETICKHLEDNEEMSYRQHGFVKNKLCHTNVISFPHRIIDLADMEEAVVVIYLDPSKVSDTVSYNILINKRRKCGLGETSKEWVPNWIESHTEENNFQWFAVKGCIKWTTQRSLLAWYYSLLMNWMIKENVVLLHCTLHIDGKSSTSAAEQDKYCRWSWLFWNSHKK